MRFFFRRVYIVNISSISIAVIITVAMLGICVFLPPPQPIRSRQMATHLESGAFSTPLSPHAVNWRYINKHWLDLKTEDVCTQTIGRAMCIFSLGTPAGHVWSHSVWLRGKITQWDFCVGLYLVSFLPHICFIWTWSPYSELDWMSKFCNLLAKSN